MNLLAGLEVLSFPSFPVDEGWGEHGSLKKNKRKHVPWALKTDSVTLDFPQVLPGDSCPENTVRCKAYLLRAQILLSAPSCVSWNVPAFLSLALFIYKKRLEQPTLSRVVVRAT